MRKIILFLLCILLLPPAAGGAEEIAKVTTAQGPLKLRASASADARVLCEIPNGTCMQLLEEGADWCRVCWNDQTGYCSAAYLTLLRNADAALLDYRVLRQGDLGDDVLAVKQRLQELGYIRSGSELNNHYNDILTERIILFQRQTGMTETGIASQELQAYLFSDRAPVCTQTLPQIRTPVRSDTRNRVICGCCWGEGCECCNFTGWIYY